MDVVEEFVAHEGQTHRAHSDGIRLGIQGHHVDTEVLLRRLELTQHLFGGVGRAVFRNDNGGLFPKGGDARELLKRGGEFVRNVARGADNDASGLVHTGSFHIREGLDGDVSGTPC